MYKLRPSFAIKAAVFALFTLAATPGWANEVEDEERAVERQQESDGQAPAISDGQDTDNAKGTPGEQTEPQPADPAPLPLSLLGRLVEPGSFATLHWTPDQSFASIATPVPVLVAHGDKAGPRLCLTAAIHGDELNGIETVRRVLHEFDPERLSGTLVGKQGLD